MSEFKLLSLPLSLSLQDSHDWYSTPNEFSSIRFCCSMTHSWTPQLCNSTLCIKETFASVLLPSHTNIANWAVEESNIWNSILISLNQLVTILCVCMCVCTLYVHGAYPIMHTFLMPNQCKCESIRFQLCPSLGLLERSVILYSKVNSLLVKTFTQAVQVLFTLINPKTDSS